MIGMKLRQHLHQQIKSRLSVKFVLLAAFAAFLFGTTVAFLIAINTGMWGDSSGKTGNDSSLNDGDIICKFTWNNGETTKAEIGPDAISVSKNAFVSGGGRSSTDALNAGKPGAPINLVLPGSPYFDTEGIDVSIDFRRSEGSGNFFTRGNVFNFGMDKGNIVIHYRIENGKGGYTTISENTGYTIALDEIWRNYRFIYTPSTGKGEVFVNSAIIWSNQAPPNTKLAWKNSGDVIIGKDMDGGGASDKSLFDNLVIRSTGYVETTLHTLLAFTAVPYDDKMLISWSMIPSVNDRSFTVERSVNGVDFSKIGVVNAVPASNMVNDYLFTDVKPVASGITYYRLKHYSNDGQFVQYTATAVSTKNKFSEELVIDNVEPQPFKTSLDVSYSTAISGEVLLQLFDNKGTIIYSEKMQASKGKNIYVLHPDSQLNSGTYVLNLTHNNKSVSKRIVKL
jgi:hypothetical protein